LRTLKYLMSKSMK